MRLDQAGDRHPKTNPQGISNLLHPDEKGVDVVPRGAGVQGFFVLLDLFLDEFPQELNMAEHGVLGAGQMLQDPRKDVVHLWEAFRTVQFIL